MRKTLSAPGSGRINDSIGLRIVAGRVYRSARDLNRWIEALQEATSIEAADSFDGATEELKVRIAAK